MLISVQGCYATRSCIRMVLLDASRDSSLDGNFELNFRKYLTFFMKALQPQAPLLLGDFGFPGSTHSQPGGQLSWCVGANLVGGTDCDRYAPTLCNIFGMHKRHSRQIPHESTC